MSEKSLFCSCICRFCLFCLLLSLLPGLEALCAGGMAGVPLAHAATPAITPPAGFPREAPPLEALHLSETVRDGIAEIEVSETTARTPHENLSTEPVSDGNTAGIRVLSAAGNPEKSAAASREPSVSEAAASDREAASPLTLDLTLVVDTHLPEALLTRLAVEAKRLSHLGALRTGILLRGIPGRMHNRRPDKARVAASAKLLPFVERGIALSIHPPRVRAIEALAAGSEKRQPQLPLLAITGSVNGRDLTLLIDGVTSLENALGALLSVPAATTGEAALKQMLSRALAEDTLRGNPFFAGRSRADETESAGRADRAQVLSDTLGIPAGLIASATRSTPTGADRLAEERAARRRTLESDLPPDALEFETGEHRLARITGTAATLVRLPPQ